MCIAWCTTWIATWIEGAEKEQTGCNKDNRGYTSDATSEIPLFWLVNVVEYKYEFDSDIWYGLRKRRLNPAIGLP